MSSDTNKIVAALFVVAREIKASGSGKSRESLILEYREILELLDSQKTPRSW